MGTWHTRGLRGSVLEECINFTNDYYRQKGIAVIQKIPTPITPVEMNKENSTITLAYFDKQGTVDASGAAQGVPICFSRQGGVSFLLVNFTGEGEFFLLPLEVLKFYWDKAAGGGRKSIPYDAFEDIYRIELKNGAFLNYLDAVNVYLERLDGGKD